MGIESRYRQSLVIKRLVPVTAGGDPLLGGADTTLTADSAPGDVAVTLDDVTGIVDGAWLRVGDMGETEIRQVAVDGVAGDVVTVSLAFALPHDSGDQVREVDGSGAPALDDYGQPVSAPTVFATVPGLIQPRSAHEVPAVSQAGAAIGSHVGYTALLEGLSTHDWIEMGGVRFDILAVPDAAGLGHHLELELRAVT